MKDLVMRPAKLSECPKVTHLVDIAYKKYVLRVGKKPAPMLVDYSRLIESGCVFVVLRSSHIIAAFVLEEKASHVYLDSIAVHPDYQNRGVGRDIMNFVEVFTKARGLREVRLYTNEMMVESILFYSRLGFLEVERRFHEGYHRVFFKKDL